MAKMNIVALSVPGKEYIIKDMMATRLTKKQFEYVQAHTSGRFDDWRFIPYDGTDFSWWSRIDKKLTQRKIYSGLTFDCDARGNITEY